MAPKKFWRHILTRKTEDNNKIFLHEWNSYLKKLYDSSNFIDHFETLLTREEFFSLKDIDFRVSVWLMEKLRTLKVTRQKS